MTFEGEFRGGDEVQPHESPEVMTLPLWVLAGLSIVGLALGLPEGVSRALGLESLNWEHFTEGVFAHARLHEQLEGVPELATYLLALADWNRRLGARGLLVRAGSPGARRQAGRLLAAPAQRL